MEPKEKQEIRLVEGPSLQQNVKKKIGQVGHLFVQKLQILISAHARAKMSSNATLVEKRLAVMLLMPFE